MPCMKLHTIFHAIPENSYFFIIFIAELKTCLQDPALHIIMTTLYALITALHRKMHMPSERKEAIRMQPANQKTGPDKIGIPDLAIVRNAKHNRRQSHAW